MSKSQEWLDKYNDFYCSEIAHKTTGKEGNAMIVVWIVDHLTRAKDHYYNTGSEYMDDATYDNFEEQIKSLDPSNKFLEKVGSDA